MNFRGQAEEKEQDIRLLCLHRLLTRVILRGIPLVAMLMRFFVVQSELGRGARGVVLKVTHVLDDIALGDYAVKRVAVGDNHEYLHRVCS
jgi:hypothetical protein